MSKPKLAISFSGGRSSAVMTKLLWDRHAGNHDIQITFANTGCEHEATLEFVHRCETEFGWPVVWIEAKVEPRSGVGVRHSIVNYETAARHGEPFEAAIAKYGIPNAANSQCTSRLKTEPMESYLKACGYYRGKRLNYDTAIGIRYDEIDRISSRRVENRFIYPLVEGQITKRDVAMEIRRWGFDLQIPGDHYGNCVWCWKKSLRKLMTVAKESPESFDFPRRMEQKYSRHKAKNNAGSRLFFRGDRSADDVVAMARQTRFRPYEDDLWDHGIQPGLFDEYLDVGGGCGDSCEIGHDHDDGGTEQ